MIDVYVITSMLKTVGIMLGIASGVFTLVLLTYLVAVVGVKRNHIREWAVIAKQLSIYFALVCLVLTVFGLSMLFGIASMIITVVILVVLLGIINAKITKRKEATYAQEETPYKCEFGHDILLVARFGLDDKRTPVYYTCRTCHKTHKKLYIDEASERHCKCAEPLNKITKIGLIGNKKTVYHLCPVCRKKYRRLRKSHTWTDG